MKTPFLGAFMMKFQFDSLVRPRLRGSEPDTDVGIPTSIIEGGYNSSNNSRGVSRQQQVCDITYAKMQILWL
jgi:hypothetical protein